MFQSFEPHSNQEFSYLDYYNHGSDYNSPQPSHASQNNSSFQYNQTQYDHSNQMSHCQPYSSGAFESSPWSPENEYAQAYNWSPNVAASQDLNESFGSSRDLVPLEPPRNDVFVNAGSENHDLKPAMFCDTDPSFGETSRDASGDPLQIFHAQGDCSLGFLGLLNDQSNFPPQQFSETEEAILPVSDSAYLPLPEINNFIKQENFDYMIDDLPFDNQLPYIPHCAQEVNTSGLMISDDIKIKEEEKENEIVFIQNDSNCSMKVFGNIGATSDGITFLKLRYKQRKNELILECVSCPTGLAEFPTMSHLSKHISKEHCSNTRICLICKPDAKGMNLAFDGPEDAFEHYNTYHSTTVEKCSFCDDCQMIFLSTESLQSHLETTHPSNSISNEALKSYRRFPCFLCLHPFKQSGHRKDHYGSIHKLFHKGRKVHSTKQPITEAFKTLDIFKTILPDDLLNKTDISPEPQGPIKQVDPLAEPGKERDIELKQPQTRIVLKIKRSKIKNAVKVKKEKKVKRPRKMSLNLRTKKNQKLHHNILELRPEIKACEVPPKPLLSTESDLPKPQELVPQEETIPKATFEAPPKFYIRPCLIPKLTPNKKCSKVPVKKVPILKRRGPKMSPALLKRLQEVKQKFSSPSKFLDSSRECNWRKKFPHVFARKCVVSLTDLYKNVPKGETFYRLISCKVILTRINNPT